MGRLSYSCVGMNIVVRQVAAHAVHETWNDNGMGVSVTVWVLGEESIAGNCYYSVKLRGATGFEGHDRGSII
jgi:hypothetical protein